MRCRLMKGGSGGAKGGESVSSRGNRGRGQVYPTGEKSNMNSFGATQAGQISEITISEKGESNITVVSSDGTKTSQIIPKGLILTVKNGDFVKVDQPLNINPNVGGFGQEETEIVLQNPLRIVGYLAFCFCVLLLLKHFHIYHL